MKRYKLLKDLPTFKAGDEFELTPLGALVQTTNGRTGVCAYSASTLDKFPNILTDWFEEIKEPTRWKPKEFQMYYYLASGGSVLNSAWCDSSDIDNGRFEIGNCFQTEEEAKQVVEYLKALAVVRGDATTKFTAGESNYYVYYSVESNSLRPGCNWDCIRYGVFGLPYFATEEDAQRSIYLHKNEWLTIFGIKEEDEA